jgi:hypothetical protein
MTLNSPWYSYSKLTQQCQLHCWVRKICQITLTFTAFTWKFWGSLECSKAFFFKLTGMSSMTPLTLDSVVSTIQHRCSRLNWLIKINDTAKFWFWGVSMTLLKFDSAVSMISLSLDLAVPTTFAEQMSYQTYIILNLSHTRPIIYQTYQI